ncbi:MAG: hypothetical protein WBP86_00960, partial [Thiobacillaceae bacterium]
AAGTIPGSQVETRRTTDPFLIFLCLEANFPSVRQHFFITGRWVSETHIYCTWRVGRFSGLQQHLPFQSTVYKRAASSKEIGIEFALVWTRAMPV